ncbi:MAG: GIY-YIG nuclease family protein, partial [Melioribacteraceae bacterium]|nr:GIY-YIG nuclease family protein [Melioribacteraceae bacterium]
LRLERHNAGWGKFSKKGFPWEFVYFEKFDSKSDALKRENEIKKQKSRLYILRLINAGDRADPN